MAITAQQAIDAAADLANDVDLTTWPQAFWLRSIGEAQKQIGNLLPRAYQVRTSLTLTANQTVQTLPATAVRLVRILRNLGTGGSTPGRRVAVIDEAQLDRIDPTWHASEAQGYVSHYCVDDETPRIFMVYPRPNAALILDAVVSQIPPAPDSVDDNLGLSDEFLTPIVDFMLYRAYSKNHERGDLGKSQRYYQMFERGLGIRDANDRAQSPDRTTERKAA